MTRTVRVPKEWGDIRLIENPRYRPDLDDEDGDFSAQIAENLSRRLKSSRQYVQSSLTPAVRMDDVGDDLLGE